MPAECIIRVLQTVFLLKREGKVLLSGHCRFLFTVVENFLQS
jgi:hypothetical protein